MECPLCEKNYSQKYKTKKKAKEENDKIGIEQHITGICSRECYLKYIGSYVESLIELKHEAKKTDLSLVVENVEDSNIEKVGEWPVQYHEHTSQLSIDGISKERAKELIKNNTAYFIR